MAFKTFTVGEVLTASDVNTMLMKQTVIVCTSGTRPSSPVKGMQIFETDTDQHRYWDSAAWILFSDQHAKVKTSDETVNNSTTFQADDFLVSYPLPHTAGTWRLTFFGVVNSSAVADFKWRLTLPSGASSRVSGRTRVGGSFTTADPAAGIVWQGDGADQDFQVTGYIVTTTTAGLASLEWAQNTAEATNTILRQGTELTVTRAG